MVGLSIVLDFESPLRNNNNNNNNSNNTSGKYCFSKNMISKATMTKPFSKSPPPCMVAGFLDRCFLCRSKLSPGKDIYMYKGDKAFCSMECRSNQILMDEEETSYNTTSGSKRDNSSFSTTKGPSADSQSSSSSSSYGHDRKGGRSRNEGKSVAFK